MDFDELVKQGKIKRIFRAKRKITHPNLVSHVTQRAAGKDPLFIEESDYLFMLANLKDISKKRSLDVYAFCFMPNHVHLLVSPREFELQESMRDLFSRYAMWFNNKYERKGHLFAGPYRQSVCLDDAYLLAASLYIHMNPVRSGLINDPMKYRWSSINLYHNEKLFSSFVKPDIVLGLLSNDNKKQKHIYRNLLERSTSAGKKGIIENTDAVHDLKTALQHFFPSVFSRVKKCGQIAQLSGLDLLDEEELDRQIKAYKKGRTIKSPETRKARRFLIEQLISRGYERGEIASRLGITVRTVYNILQIEA